MPCLRDLLLAACLLSGAVAATAQTNPVAKSPAVPQDGKPAQTLSAPPQPVPYLLAGDDVISITVVNFARYSLPQATVAPDGMVAPTLVDPVNVLGKTTSEVAALLTTEYKQYLKHPAVSVTLLQRRQESVLMYGQVVRPGAQPYKPPMHLVDLLAWAGGVTPVGATTPPGDLSAVVVTHRNGEKQIVDLSHPELKGGSDQDLLLQAGDVAFVPERHTEVSVLGEVLHPGSFDYKNEMTVLDAITQSGSVNPDTADFEAATLTHNGKESKLDLDGMLHHGDMTGNIKISPGDRIMIPLSQNRVYVFGSVNKPGYYTFKPKDRLFDAISYCGGAASDSDLLRVRIIHINKEKTVGVYQQVNIVNYFKKKDLTANPLLAPGDAIYVPIHNRGFNISDIWNVLAPLNLIQDSARLISGNLTNGN